MKRISRKISAQTVPPRSRAKPIMKATIAAARNPSSCIGAKSTGGACDPACVCGEELRDGVDGRRRGPPASATARTSRVPMITPSAISPTWAACSGVPMPKPTAAGASAASADGGDELRQLRRQLRALAGHAGQRDDVGEPDRRGGDLARAAPGEVVGETKPIGARPRSVSAAATESSSPGGRSGMIAPAAPACGERGGEALGAERQHDVRVDHRQHRDARRRRARRAPCTPLEASRRPRAPRSRPRGSRGPSASGSE